MVVDDKIQKAKRCFSNMTKSGYNNYQKYTYHELQDIIPIVLDICDKYKIKTKFDWNVEASTMSLIITDCEDGSTDISTIPVATVQAQDAGKHMQDIGRVQTYARRYLYLQVFDIAVPDEIDNKDQRKMVKKQTPKKAPVKQVRKQYSPVKAVKEPRDNEVTADYIQDIISTAEKQFREEQLHKLEKDRLLFTWDNAKDIIKDLCRNDEEYTICKQSTVFKTADKVK